MTTMHHDIELPAIGPEERVATAFPSLFNWEYKTRHDELMRLYEKGKQMQWNASTDIDWSIDVDPERETVQDHDVMDAILQPPQKLDTRARRRMNHHMNAWMLSQFMHGEQGALLATAEIVNTVPWIEAKFYAANQVADEARHVEVYRRYLTEKMGLSYAVNPHLRTLLNQIIGDSRWDMIYLGMQIMVEGLALAAFGLMKFTQADEPLIQQITSAVMRDEARHVAFGVLSLQDLYTKELSSTELREREEFVIEATVLMRDRLLMEEVWDRIGLDPKVWLPWSLSTPFMIGFRQMLFSKIVPNLKRLGLLTPRVRAKYAELNILQFESMPDSTIDEEVAMPPALATFFARLVQAGVQLPGVDAN
ncbi:MAG: ferritin-like domain-containing protein [Deltaproteobacteria bacterium]|nr:ferritin-like domain-containing protein [Deltaproteobacteria bacterium]MBI3388065.1 ferritin-like domain-containing protein [Deltaproteobacteria bacterium]